MLHKKGSFKTIQDGSKKDTSFKTIVNRVNNLKPLIHGAWPMRQLKAFQTPSQWRRHRKSQNSHPSGPPPSRIMIQPHLHGARISNHQQYQGPPRLCTPTASTALETCRVSTTSRLTLQVPTSPAWQMEGFPLRYKEEIEKELAEMVQQRIITKQTEPTPWGQQPDVPKEGKQQAENMPWPQGPKQGNHPWEPQSTNPSRR